MFPYKQLSVTEGYSFYKENRMQTKTPRDLLENAIEKTFDCGLRRAVLVVGSGLHSQLLGSKEAKNSALSSWRTLIANIAPDMSEMLNSCQDLTSAWESLVAQRFHSSGKLQKLQFAQVERHLLRNYLIPELERAEREFRGDNQKEVGPNTLAEIFSMHRDIVTFNFDRKIDRLITERASSSRGGSIHPSPSKVVGPTKRPMLRVDLGSQRIWHPHGIGHSKSTAPSIQLGVHGYSTAVQQVTSLIREFRKSQSAWCKNEGVSATGRWPDHQHKRWEESVRGITENENPNWVEMCMVSDLIFIGCGMQQIELDLWVLLHARQRQFLRVGDSRPRAFVLCDNKTAESAAHLKYRPADIVLVPFDSHDEAWTALLGKRN
jgi:hypothetical protein